jgi:hypothetical protein
VYYSKPMPDIERLMQLWPVEFEELLRTVKDPRTLRAGVAWLIMRSTYTQHLSLILLARCACHHLTLAHASCVPSLSHVWFCLQTRLPSSSLEMSLSVRCLRLRSQLLYLEQFCVAAHSAPSRLPLPTPHLYSVLTLTLCLNILTLPPPVPYPYTPHP